MRQGRTGEQGKARMYSRVLDMDMEIFTKLRERSCVFGQLGREGVGNLFSEESGCTFAEG